jgi:phosphoribosylanthranilate isomerase
MVQIKICGITQPEQGRAIAQLGADLLGFICVPQSPRYVTPQQIYQVVSQLSEFTYPPVSVGVFANVNLEQIAETVVIGQLKGIQLHGDESSVFCHMLKQQFPHCQLIKALRIRSVSDLELAHSYGESVDSLLLDAYNPKVLGGTGHTLDWPMLKQFNPNIPWFLAGGLKPDNVAMALETVNPNGLDVSSGVERSPGDKDLDKVKQLITTVRNFSS